MQAVVAALKVVGGHEWQQERKYIFCTRDTNFARVIRHGSLLSHHWLAPSSEQVQGVDISRRESQANWHGDLLGDAFYQRCEYSVLVELVFSRPFCACTGLRGKVVVQVNVLPPLTLDDVGSSGDP